MVEYIVKALVDNPEQVVVSEIKGTKTSVLELSVAKGDLGKVIGKHGRNINAIRIIIIAASATARRGRTVLEIIE